MVTGVTSRVQRFDATHAYSLARGHLLARERIDISFIYTDLITGGIPDSAKRTALLALLNWAPVPINGATRWM